MQLLLLPACLLLAASAFASPLNDNPPSEPRVAVPSNTDGIISPFLKLIRTNDVMMREATYSSPAVVFVGMENKVLRCLHEDPNECEVFATTFTFVNSLCVHGEHLYVGLQKGVILKCDLNQKESCINFHTGAESEVNAFAIANGYLYVALYFGTILRCVLDEPNSCQPFHVPDESLFSLIHYNEYIYAGLGNGTLLRCSLTSENSCLQLYNTTASTEYEGIMGLSIVENNLFAVTQEEPHLWNCTLKSDATVDDCASMPLNFSAARNMVSFKGVLYTLERGKGLYICKWGNDTECSNYGSFDGVWTMTFAFGAYYSYIQSRYHNEDKSCVWQRHSKCPPLITHNAKVHVKDGKLYNSQGLLVDTEDADQGQTGPAAIFAMSPDGTIFLSKRHVTELMHTSSLLGGQPVSGAGEMVVSKGAIEKIIICPNHYRPDLNLNRQVVESLRSQGYTDHIELEECSEDVRVVLTQHASSNVNHDDERYLNDVEFDYDPKNTSKIPGA